MGVYFVCWKKFGLLLIMQTGTIKPKARPGVSTQTGVYKVDSIKVSRTTIPANFLLTTYAKDIAESLNITIPENVASSLASDVEYRINQLIEVL